MKESWRDMFQFVDMNKEIQHNNRIKSKLPKFHSAHWCDYCAKQPVQPGMKCSGCGNVDKEKRVTNETNYD